MENVKTPQTSNRDAIHEFFHTYRPLIILATLILSAVLGFVTMTFNSLFGIGMLVALILAMLAFINSESTTIFVSFLFYANIPVVATRQGLPEIIAASIFLLLGLPLLNYLLVKREDIVINRGFVLMIGYLGLLLLSALFSDDFAQSYDRLFNFVTEGLILYFLFINTIRTPDILRKVIWAVIAAGILMGSLSIVQQATGNYENDFFGLAQTKDKEISVGDADFLGNQPQARRLSGPIGSKNRYAQIMLVLLPLVVVRFWAEDRKWLKLVTVYSIIPIMAGALLTFSRMTGVTLIALWLAMVLFRLISPRRALLLGAIGALGVIIFLPGFAYRFSTVVDVAPLFTGEPTQDIDGAIRGRATENLAGIYIFLDHPLLGAGPGQAQLYTRAYGNELGLRWLESDRRLHNLYIEELADTGIIGFVGFLSIIGVTLKELNDVRIFWRGRNREYYYTIVGMLLLLLTYLVTGIFLHLSYVRYYWFLLALSGAAAIVYNNEAKRIGQNE